MVTLYHFWSSPPSQRVRMALQCKQVEYSDHPLSYHDDQTFFELGIARQAPVLQLEDGTLLTDANEILWRIDELFPETPKLVEEKIDRAAWDALLSWRQKVDEILARLYAPVLPAYADIAEDEESHNAYKRDAEQHFGQNIEALSNDRYAGFAQLQRITRLKELTRHLAKQGHYMPELSIADLLLVADLHPLQLLDGVTIPLDLMYYFQRIERECHCRLNDGIVIST